MEKHRAVLQYKCFTTPRPIAGSKKLRKIPGTTKIRPVLEVFVSEDQGLLCIDVEVSSPLHGNAWILRSSGLTTMGTYIVRIRTRN